jgi:Pyruvate/2-oxoacid:ferredoxin oxidoreductase delta subunit/rubredoxin
MADEGRRRFVKHLGLAGAAGFIGITIARFTQSPVDKQMDKLEDAEQERGYRKVWATKRDEEASYGAPYIDYFEDAERLGIWYCTTCGYIYDVTDGRKQRFDELPSDWVCTNPGCTGTPKDEFTSLGIGFRSGGQPLINEVACAYHFDVDNDGNYDPSDEGVNCSMPCRTICPVEAITKGTFAEIAGEDERGKKGPIVDYDKCIGCGRCHKVCGYNVIEWVIQPYTGKNAANLGGGT